LTSESEMIVRLKTDLQKLQKLTPQIQGDLAEFTIPPEPPSDDDLRLQRMGAEPKVARTVRFSRIEGKWRFHAQP
ncbi:MAG: hypothetical protein KDA85_04740, partial [Planctomycetaceae bacterium]|nr:hypothetical protein [Planctomycetaceae bacterium]